jgi:hypothetical protein
MTCALGPAFGSASIAFFLCLWRWLGTERIQQRLDHFRGSLAGDAAAR